MNAKKTKIVQPFHVLKLNGGGVSGETELPRDHLHKIFTKSIDIDGKMIREQKEFSLPRRHSRDQIKFWWGYKMENC